MTKRQWGRLITAVVFMGCIFFGVFGSVLLWNDYVRGDTPNPRTQALIDGPRELKILCSDKRGVNHVLSCGVNIDVKGRWVVFEYIDGVPMGGLVSNYAISEWELRIGANVSPDILIQFYPSGSNIPLQLDYRMDTDYMRAGLRNFPGNEA